MDMPELCRFYGIVIRMFVEAGERHHRPHFHANYQEFAAIFAIEPLQLIAGSLPQRQRRLVEAWAELHEPELLHDWTMLTSGKLPESIKPLQ
jgi:hypothetical protein